MKRKERSCGLLALAISFQILKQVLKPIAEEEEEEDVTAVPAKARLISQLSNQATVQTKHEAGMGVIEAMLDNDRA